MRWHSDRSTRARWEVAAVWTVAVLSIGAAVAGAVLASSDGYALNFGGGPDGWMSVTMGLSLPGLAAAILTVRPRDRVGLVLGALGTLRAICVFAIAWSYHGLVADPGSRLWASPASIVGGMALIATPFLLPLLVAWVPDGQAPHSFRWIPKTALVMLTFVVVVVGVLAWPDQGAEILTKDVSTGWRGSVGEAVLSVGMLVAYSLSALGLVGLLEKWRLSAGVMRQQLKWVLFGVVVAVTTNIVAAIVPALWAFRVGGFVAMLVSIGVAVFRYRLFDIDRLIKGTILYGGLTAVLLGVVATTGTLAGSAFRLGTGTSVVAASLATALALVVLRPVHGWAQDRLDRLFDRGGWEATRRIRAFTARSGREPPEPGDLQTLLGDVLDDPELTVTYRLADGAHLDPWGRPAAVSATEAVEVDAVALGSATAVITHRPTTAGDGNRLRRVLEESVVPFEHGRVQADLGRQLGALRDSRARLVAAGDTERRRIERDLHDGAQNQLVALGLALRSGQRRAEPGELGGAADALIDQAVAGILEAVVELRRFAQGVISPLLVSNGIGAAVSELAARLPVPVTVDIDVPTRPPGPIESVLWYVTCEATTNALKHAPGAVIGISIHAVDAELRVEVTDAGPGGASCGRGSGLRGLVDRVEAVGGRLEVVSPAGAGTTVRAVIPCAS